MLYRKVCFCMGCLLFHICYHFVYYYYILHHYKYCDNLGEYIKVCYSQELLFHPACNLLIFILPSGDINWLINIVQSQSIRVHKVLFTFIYVHACSDCIHSSFSCVHWHWLKFTYVYWFSACVQFCSTCVLLTLSVYLCSACVHRC